MILDQKHQRMSVITQALTKFNNTRIIFLIWENFQFKLKYIARRVSPK